MTNINNNNGIDQHYSRIWRTGMFESLGQVYNAAYLASNLN